MSAGAPVFGGGSCLLGDCAAWLLGGSVLRGLGCAVACRLGLGSHLAIGSSPGFRSYLAVGSSCAVGPGFAVGRRAGSKARRLALVLQTPHAATPHVELDAAALRARLDHRAVEGHPVAI